MEKLSVTIREAAEATSLSEGTIRKKVNSGELDSSRVDRRVLVSFESLQKLVGAKAVTNAE